MFKSLKVIPFLSLSLSLALSAHADDGARVTVDKAMQKQDAVNSYQEMDLGSVDSEKSNGKTYSNVYVHKVTQVQTGSGKTQILVIGRNEGKFARTARTNVTIGGSIAQIQTESSERKQNIRIGTIE